MKIEIPPIIVDTREQCPYDFEHPTIRKSLKTGDYSVEGYENIFAVERKELGDFLNCVGSQRERFEKELERSKTMRRLWVVVEGTFRSIQKGLYQSKIHPNSVIGSIVAWENRFDAVRVILAGDRDLGQQITYKIMFRSFLDDFEGKI